MKRLLFFLFFSFIFSNSFAQAPISPASNRIKHKHLNWFTYFGQYKLNSHWGIHADVQFRLDEDLKYSRQNLFRAGLIRYLKPNLNLTTGYAYINTYSDPLDNYFTEHRAWEQLLYSKQLGKFNMTNRVRLEQRFVEKLMVDDEGKTLTNGTNYGNRIRYFNRTIFNLTKMPAAPNVFYLALQDEIFFNVAAPDLNKNVLDQNRFLVGFGVFHDNKTRLELGYMNQLVNPFKQAKTMNHIVHVSVLQTLDFSSKE